MPQSWHSHQPWHTQRFPHCVAHLILITWAGAGREGSSIPGLFLGETEAPGVRRLPWLTLDGSPYMSHCPSRHGVSPCPSSAVISVSLFFFPECALIFCRAEATLCASRQSVLVPFRPLVSKSRHFQRAAIIPLGSFVQSSVNNLFGFEGLETETPIEPLGNQVSSASAT